MAFTFNPFAGRRPDAPTDFSFMNEPFSTGGGGMSAADQHINRFIAGAPIRRSIGGGSFQEGLNMRADARQNAAGGGVPNFFDQLTMAGFQDFNRTEAAEQQRAGAVGGVADQFEDFLGNFDAGLEERLGGADRALESEAQRLSSIGEDQVNRFEDKIDGLFGNIEGRVDNALADFEKVSLADASATAFAVARASEQRVKQIQADPNIPESAKQEFINREIGDMEAQKQATVSRQLENLRNNLFQGRLQGAGLLAQTGSALTGQFASVLAGQREMEQTAAGLRQFKEALKVNSTMDAAQLRMQGLSALADLRERAVASPSSLFALLSTLAQAAASPTLQNRQGLDFNLIQQRVG